MLGVNREEQVGVKYRYDQRTGQEVIVIPSDWLETNIASTEFKRSHLKNLKTRLEERKSFLIESSNEQENEERKGG